MNKLSNIPFGTTINLTKTNSSAIIYDGKDYLILPLSEVEDFTTNTRILLSSVNNSELRELTKSEVSDLLANVPSTKPIYEVALRSTWADGISPLIATITNRITYCNTKVVGFTFPNDDQTHFLSEPDFLLQYSPHEPSIIDKLTDEPVLCFDGNNTPVFVSKQSAPAMTAPLTPFTIDDAKQYILKP